MSAIIDQLLSNIPFMMLLFGALLEKHSSNQTKQKLRARIYELECLQEENQDYEDDQLYY